MPRLDALVQEFLSQRRIAVVGVSDTRESGCNLAYRNFKAAGHTVYAVNPRLTTFAGDPCYPHLSATPEKAEAVFILTNPKITDQIVQQCIDLGIRYVWMHCLLGTRPGLVPNVTSVSPNAVRLCRDHGITVIPGSCPNQFLRPDFGHSLMRVTCRALGLQQIHQTS